MKKTNIQRLLLLITCLLIIVSAVLAQNLEPSTGEDWSHRQIRPELHTVTENWYATQKAGGKWQVVGEVLLKNSGWGTRNIKEITLNLFTVGGIERRVYGSAEFNDMLFVARRARNGAYYPKPPGTTTVGLQDEAVALLTNNDLTDHKPVFAWVQVRFEHGRNANLMTRISEFEESVRFEMPFDIDPDLYWFAGNTAGTYGHWPALFPQPYTNVFLSQRYAVDVIQVRDDGTSSFPSESPNKEDYFAWNKDVKSAESGQVIAIVNDLPDVEIGQVDGEHPAGNYVVIKHAPNVYTIYGHLKQASVLVQTGQKVDRGQVLGKIGNSGNTSEPHLHFHAMDRWDFAHPVLSGLTSQGIPALFWNASVFRNGEVLPLNGHSLGEGDVIVE